MTSLRPNLVKRIDRRPKPTNVAAAMQPLFEAISNAIRSAQGRFDDAVSVNGRVVVTVNTSRKKENVWATVEDIGDGLNDKNWEAFTTTDTDNKIRIGGKGVGPLLRLDCFRSTHVASDFLEGETVKRREFDFALAVENRIQNETIKQSPVDSSSFHVRFEGLRDNGYAAKFRGRDNFVSSTLRGTSCRPLSVAAARP